MNTGSKPRLIAIVGGSGAGKTWLANRLQQAFEWQASSLSLDDFYKDRSHLPPARRSRINYDQPGAIDWHAVEAAVREALAGRASCVPQYNLATHTRLAKLKLWTPTPLVLVEGLWLLWRSAVRELFDLRIFLDCPKQLRFERRLARDVAERGRAPDSVREQYWSNVAPMHERFVAPQVRHADLVLNQPLGETEVLNLIETIRALAAKTETDDLLPRSGMPSVPAMRHPASVASLSGDAISIAAAPLRTVRKQL